MKQIDLDQWEVCDPQNRQDTLPQPYGLISAVMKQTILHKLDLAMFEIQQKKKDSNYEGSVRQYFSQNSMDLQSPACISSQSNKHNHLLAGDKNGTIYLLDLAKKVVFSKKDLCSSRRVIHIAQNFVTDGQVTFTTIAVVLNQHNKVYILRFLHGEQKLILTYEITVADGTGDPNKLPYECQWEQYSRLLFVKTYDGNILLYRIPELKLDLDAINRTQSIPLEQQEFKKRLRYPLNFALIQSQCTQIKNPILRLKFPGKKVFQRKEGSDGPQTESNPPLQPIELLLQNGQDQTPSYCIPKFEPYIWVIYRKVELPKKKEFQRGKYIEIAERIIYGWKNVKTFETAYLFHPKANYYPDHMYVQHFLQRIPDEFAKTKKQYLSQQVVLRNKKTLKCIYDITATCLNQSDQIYFATGMANGTTSVWSTNAFNILLNTRKHQGAVTCLAFFEGWKVISGSSKGEVNIDNLIGKNNQVSRTNTFESKVDYPIITIKISHLGIAFVLDKNSNLRAYDLWRNEKVAKVMSCNNFAILENKGKRWLNSPSITLYTNNDFTAIISTNWPNYTPRQIEQSQTKKKQVNQLLNNPWKCKGTNLHVVRNFQFLLNLFEGLETIYKKGYDRKKVQNLFSNLEFTQLYDRAFDIPDFGVTSNPFRKPTQTKFNQSNKSFVSSKSRQKIMKESSSGASRAKQTLTNQALHPQKFLFQRRKITGDQVFTEEKLKAKILESYKRQSALQAALQNNLSKGLL